MLGDYMKKLKEILDKIRNDKRLLYLLSTTVLILFALALNIAFSSFSHTSSNAIANIKVKGMEYSMTINGTAETIFNGTANDITKANISITSLNTLDSKYELIYHICSDSSCSSYLTMPEGLTIKVSSLTTDPVTETISSSGLKTVRIVVTNTTSTLYYIKLDINAGYSYNALALQNMITDTYDEDDVTIAAYIDGTLSTTFPTTNGYKGTVTCKVNGAAANATGTASWNGSKWLVNITGADTGETRCNVNFVTLLDLSGANEPLLADNMIPVYYDNTNDVWVKADVNNANATYKWHDYDAQMWANAVTVTSTTRSTYTSAAVGTQIPMSDILGMWVWIPRYEYMTTNLGTQYAGGTQSLPGGISIKFISGTSTTNDTNYLIHPAFRNGTVYKYSADYDLGGWDKELTGFWMGKFETGYATNNTTNAAISSNILVKPDVYSMRYQTVSNEYTTVANIQSDHGIGSTVETHMSKNDEWGAVTYLSQSAYGKYGNTSYTGANKEVYVNNAYYSTGPIFTTGRSNGTYGGGTGSGTAQYGTYEYNNCPASAYTHTACTETVRNTNNTKGTGASTTGNIYGVYDMSGGAWEYVMANYAGTISTSGFSSMPSQKYWNKYTSTTLASACNGSPCYGQAITETSGWYIDYMNFVTSSNPWAGRGSVADDASYTFAGVFNFYVNDGGALNYSGVRASIS